MRRLCTTFLILSFWLILPARAQDYAPQCQRLEANLPVYPTVLQLEKAVGQQWPASGVSRWAETVRTQSLAGTHIQLQQVYEGIPLWGAGLKLNLDKTGRVVSAWVNPYVQELKHPFPVHTDVVPPAALLHTLTVSGHAPLYEVAPWYCFQPQDSSWHAVWAISTVREPGTGDSWLRLYDAHSGRLIHSQSRALHLTRDTLAHALVFYPNPITTARTSYGAHPNYTDNNDQTNDSLDAQRRAVKLQQVTYDEDTQLFLLEGPFVRIVNVGGPAVIPAASAVDSFYFHRGQTGFEDVNAYYHIDTVQRYVQHMGYTNLFNSSLQVDAHGSTADNSNFVPAGEESYIRMGTGGVDDAEDAGVIVHEYGHALSHAASPNTLTGTERLGIEEGNADYICASYARRLDEYGWDRLFNWDGHNPFWPGRSATFDQTYSQVMGKSFVNNYELAQVWASALMQVWTAHGAAKTDKLVLQALYMTASNMTLPQGVQNLLDADTLLFGGELSTHLYMAFCAYQVLDPATCARYASRETVQEGFPGRIYPVPAATRLHFRASQPLPPGTAYKILDTRGALLEQGALQSWHSWDIAHWPKGLYLLQIQHNGNLSTQRFLLAQ
ncbi:MAG: T9SS type A sorting domain-containing protein [Bacteroidetes bacterium]|nr:T9SS type A sorting domain-containing protein [Bacteroidota bacterium]